MISDLIKLGILRKKTFKLDERVLSFLEEENKRHFILGYFDGDGSVGIGTHNRMIMSFCGSLNLMDEIRTTFIDKTGCFFSEPGKNNNIFSITLAINEQRFPKIKKFLYEDGSKDFLERKHNLFLKKEELFKENHLPEKTKSYVRTREINKLKTIINSAQRELDKLLECGEAA